MKDAQAESGERAIPIPLPLAKGRRVQKPLALKLDTESLDQLKTRGTQQAYQRGQVVFYEGHRPLGVYVHESGKIAFLKGRRKVRECADPCVLGFQVLMADVGLPFSARAESEVALTFVGRTALQRIREEQPALYQQLEKAAGDAA
ncbi:MAG: cyclic nucleotide-binding domain-containing protein [Nitrospirae bacterium]|nr:cyclic nucleotide-binding domain-containing protein [Nitrospirota bacterium]